ncbi:MAG TPA: hypothetical protein VLW50_16295 [Streptosporangiaceae bacterium]|nr:hypothetical protein [Streptosporangiaceae bacterium]
MATAARNPHDGEILRIALLTGLRVAPCRGRAAGAAFVVRTLALQAALILTTAVAARHGDAAIAAHQMAARCWTLLAFALGAIAIAGQLIIGATSVRATSPEPARRRGR